MLTFLDKLDDEQIANAEKVAKAARRAGVDPKLAVAIAFRESSLRANPPRGSSGEIGIMQVMPGTGRGIGFDEKKLQDVDQNIEAGIAYLKQGLQATGNDPKLAAVYYNGGPGAVQALSSGKDPDPRVIEYVRSINSFGTFGRPAQAEQPATPPAAQAAPMEQPPAGAMPEEAPAETDAERDARIQQAIEAQNRRMGQLYGAGVGAGVSAGRGLAGLARSGIEGAGQAYGRGLQAGMQPPGALPGAGAAPALPGALPGARGAAPGAPAGVPPGTPPGMYPPATGPGSATANYGRVFGLPEIEAQRALGLGKQQGEVWDLMERRRAALQDIQQRFPTERYVENPRFGGIMTPDPGAGGGPRAQYVQPEPSAVQPTPRAGAAPAQQLTQLPPPQPVPTTPPAPTGLQAVTQELRALARPVVSALGAASRFVAPPLGLATAGGEAATVESELRRQDPDYIKAALSGITGLSGLAALYPPATLPAAAIGGGSALASYLREKEPIGPFEPRFSLQSTAP